MDPEGIMLTEKKSIAKGNLPHDSMSIKHCQNDRTIEMENRIVVAWGPG